MPASRPTHPVFAAAILVTGGALPVPAWAADDIAPPVLVEPQRLSPAEVGRGLRLRLDAMAADDADRQVRRGEEGSRDYALPDGGPEAPLPPDAPGGEAEVGRAGGGE